MLRKITLSLLLLVSLGIMLPLAGSLAHGLRQSIEMSSSVHHRRHSHAWWRRHRARMRKRRAAAFALRNANLSASLLNIDATSGSIPTPPDGAHAAGSSELRSTATNTTSAGPGTLAVSVVALSRPNSTFLTPREEKRMLSGVAVADLRRIVIDKMMVSGGWVTNDFVREVNGSRVFVVTAQTPKDANSPEKAWSFYFTEVDGRIYGVTTSAPAESADRMATEAEKYIGNLRSTSAKQPVVEKR